MSILTAYDKFMQQALKYGWLERGPTKTGQTVKYRTGDDGDFEKGTPVSVARFTDNGNGTITDNATGLMWAKDGNGVGCGGGATKLWAAAIDWAVGLSFAGYSDWRLPNVKELMSIVDYSKHTPCIDATYFPNTQPNHYWSSTTYAPTTTSGWSVFFGTGLISGRVKSTGDHYIRAVRLGQGS